MTNEQKIKQLDRILDEVGVYHRAVGKLGFDMKAESKGQTVRAGGTAVATRVKKIIFACDAGMEERR